jgi:outer membrane protein OmpA-like peptidoglycan-associated protein
MQHKNYKYRHGLIPPISTGRILRALLLTLTLGFGLAIAPPLSFAEDEESSVEIDMDVLNALGGYFEDGPEEHPTPSEPSLIILQPEQGVEIMTKEARQPILDKHKKAQAPAKKASVTKTALIENLPLPRLKPDVPIYFENRVLPKAITSKAPQSSGYDERDITLRYNEAQLRNMPKKNGKVVTEGFVMPAVPAKSVQSTTTAYTDEKNLSPLQQKLQTPKVSDSTEKLTSTEAAVEISSTNAAQPLDTLIPPKKTPQESQIVNITALEDLSDKQDIVDITADVSTNISDESETEDIVINISDSESTAELPLDPVIKPSEIGSIADITEDTEETQAIDSTELANLKVPRMPSKQFAQDIFVTLPFSKGDGDLTEQSQDLIKEQILGNLKEKPSWRLQIQAFASPKVKGATNEARRLSLTRALAVRSYLLENGIEASRMDVRALGTQSDRNPLDRVDLVFFDPEEQNSL